MCTSVMRPYEVLIGARLYYPILDVGILKKGEHLHVNMNVYVRDNLIKYNNVYKVSLKSVYI